MNFLQRHRLRKQAEELLRHCQGVLHMRRDLLSDADRTRLSAAIEALAAARKNRRAPEALPTAMMQAEEAVGAANPPRALPQMRELAETLVVAFGVAMAFRAYFFQPFKIPTGSMQPTLYGHHSVGRTADGAPIEPAWLDHMPLKPLKWLVTGEWYGEIVAREGGSVVVSADRARAPGYVTVAVRGRRHKLPHDAFEAGELRIRDFRRVQETALADSGGATIDILGRGTALRGDRIWSGYRTFGDHVFVNRMKWYFFPPRRGQIVVFSTDGIADLNAGEHYIKRLVGLPGETIGVRPPHLTTDGREILEPESVRRVAEKRAAWTDGPRYLGYRPTGHSHFLSQVRRIQVRCPLGLEGDALTLGSNEFLAMGDNTVNSFDGRYWGPVPRRRLVGPASCIYWPFSPRWGLVD